MALLKIQINFPQKVMQNEKKLELVSERERIVGKYAKELIAKSKF